MICPNCGRETPDGMAFCFNCGAKLAAPVQQAQQAAEQAQREAQAQAEQARLQAEEAARQQAEQARLQAEEAARQQAEQARLQAEEAARQQAEQAQAQAQQAQQQYQQYGPQQYQQYGPQGPQQYQQQYQQPYQPQYQQQYQAPPKPKEPSKFDKLLKGEPPLVLDFYTKRYNTLLAVGSMVAFAFIGIVFALLMGSTGWTLTLLFLAASTLGVSIVAQVMLSNNKVLGWILTLAAGGLRWLTLFLSMIALFANIRRATAAILFNVFYFIMALMIQGALLALAVLVFIKNKDKCK